MMKKQLPHCNVELTVTLISDRWKILILRDLLTGTKRFGELKKSVSGISQKVLTAHLRSMEDDGLVNRKIYAQIPFWMQWLSGAKRTDAKCKILYNKLQPF